MPKGIGRILVIMGAILIGLYMMRDPMDEETALFRSGASTEEVLAAREQETKNDDNLSIFLLGGGLVLIGFSLNRLVRR